MPGKNLKRQLLPNGIYHAYNRGFEKREVFKDGADYLNYTELVRQEIIKNPGKVIIYAYCLLPNHFHFLIKQSSKYDMPRFMQVVTAEYTRYFNHRYKRYGRLWENAYRAVLIKDHYQFVTVQNYIHRNPSDITENIEKYPYSSYGHYKHRFKLDFIKKGRPLRPLSPSTEPLSFPNLDIE